MNAARAKAEAQAKPSSCLSTDILNGYGVDISSSANAQGYYTYSLFAMCNGNKYSVQTYNLPLGVTVAASPLTTTNSVFFPVITSAVTGSGTIELTGSALPSACITVYSSGLISQSSSACAQLTPTPTPTSGPVPTSTPTPTPTPIVPTATPTPTPTLVPTATPTPTPTPTYTGPYYVSTTGSDTNPGTQSLPFATINKANSVVVPGDTVYVEAGTYNQYVKTTTSGTSSQPITYISQSTWAAAIVNSGATNNNGATWNNTGNYIEIIGFDISGGQRLGILNYGTNVTIQQNHIHDVAYNYCTSSGGAGIDSADSITTVGYTIINRNLINKVGLPQPCSYVHGIYVQRSYETVINNIIVDNGGLGIACTHSCTAPTIANNDVLNNGYGIRIGWSSTAAGNTSNAIISNNIVAYNLSNAAIYENSTPGTIGTGNQYLNNMFYGNASNTCTLYNGDTCVNTLVADPSFINYQPDGSGNYQVSSTSRAVDSGTSTGAPSMDYAGNPRPQGRGYDRGAYEQ